MAYFWQFLIDPPSVLSPQAIRRYVLKVLLNIWLLFTLALVPTPRAYAEGQGGEKGTSAYTRISKEELLSRLQLGQGVEGRVIKGDDIIAILKNTGVKIQIGHSVIEGGLDFTTLPRTPMGAVQLPPDWSDKQREKWRAQHSDLPGIPVVTNEIFIADTEIRPEPQLIVAVEATGTFFSGTADFSRASFSGWADFSSASFSGRADFSSASFSGQADFSRASFSGGAFFSRASFSGGAFFSDASFSGWANFVSASFSGRANFVSASFSGWADFSSASFDELACFKDAQFFDTLVLRFTKFKLSADFRNTKIHRLDFNNAASPMVIEGRCDFRHALVSDSLLHDVTFEKDVDFSDATFGVAVEVLAEGFVGPPESLRFHTDFSTIFRFVTFEGNAYFLRTTFATKTSLERVNFKKEADFTEAKFTVPEQNSRGAFSLSYLRFTNLRLSWHQLPSPALWVRNNGERIKSYVERETEEEATKQSGQQNPVSFPDTELEALSSVFESFEANFHRQDQLADANEAYYQMKLAELQEARERRWSWDRSVKEGAWFVWGLPCGYGRKLWRVLWLSFGVNLLFTLLYSTRGELLRYDNPGEKQDFTFKLRLLDLPRDYLAQGVQSKVRPKGASNEDPTNQRESEAAQGHIFRVEDGGIRKFGIAFLFSTVILLRIGFRDTTISGHVGRLNLRHLVTFEWWLGLALVAALTITLANTQPLLNKLITGVF